MDEKSTKSGRNARLAEALRANLRRRREQTKRRGTGGLASGAGEPQSGTDGAINPPQASRKDPDRVG